MRVHLVLVVLVFAAAHAHAEPAEQTGGRHYISAGLENVALSTAPGAAGWERAGAIDAGYRLGASPIYAHAAVAAAPSRYLDTRAGIELRVGTVVRGLFGLDVGYQHDERMVDRPFSVEGALIAPRLGVEVGSEDWWVRGTIDWRYSDGGGRASALALVAGHDF